MQSAALAPIGWIPFLEPMPAAHAAWWLSIIPIALGVSLAWKAVRLETIEGWQRAVAMMALQIVLAVVGIAIGLYLLVQWIVPLLPAD